MDWFSFSIKNHNKEQWAFEQMAYLLFCAEFNNDIGLFRYKNQTGIETEPLEREGRWYGFSAKFYEVALKDRKTKIIENITTAKKKNPKLNVIYFYVNKELSESSKTDTKKPDYQIEIEKECEQLDLKIEWRVPSHFELQLALPKNKYINDLFFNLNPTLDKLLDNIKQHNLNILNAIRTAISVGDKKFKLDRTEWVIKLYEKINLKQNIILSGEGGSGKTAIIKHLYKTYSSNIPICIFKASELNINHLSHLFKFDHDFSLSEFFETYSNESTKIFIIDSAEKLSEINNQNVLNELITKLSAHNWTIIFTTRLSYLNDLKFHLKESYDLKYEILKLNKISNEELNHISQEFDIELPKNENFRDRIRNLFYLNEYIKYQYNENIGTFPEFIDLLWKKKIQNNQIQKNDIDIERGRCFLEIAKKRAQTGKFYIDGYGLSRKAIAGLKQDEILGYDEKHDGYFITHDIYEEWGLNRIINQAYQNYNLEDFFQSIGHSLPIRRAFRNWLSQQLQEKNTKDIKKFIKAIFKHSSLEQFWKDELLISILLDNYAEEFFQFFEYDLVTDDYLVLKRILFLLQIACNDVSELHYDSKPKGAGWDTTIAFIYQHKDVFFKNYYKLVLPILYAWSQANHQGATTRLAGLLALYLLQESETQKKLYRHDKTEELVYKIIFTTCDEIEDELTEIFDIVTQHQMVEYNHPYNQFCRLILEKSYQANRLIQLLPKHIISLCELFWLEKNYKKSPYSRSNHDLEIHYGIHSSGLDYFPASANQTPIRWLLNSKKCLSAIDFIISFINETVENYSKSNFDYVIQTKITIKGNEVTQFHNPTLWMMYRGIGSPITPNLLQSIHMALEKFLLEIAKTLNRKVVETLLLRILSNSRSSSLTSVVCSIVLAYPNKFANIALILFSSKDFFHADLSRCVSENLVKLHISIGYSLDQTTNILFNDERLKTCEDEHRKNNLESLCLQYQLVGVDGYSDEENSKFIENIFHLLDVHSASFTNSKEDIIRSILFTRMDKRKLKPKFIENENNFFLLAELTEIQKQLSENSQIKNNEFRKYLDINLWSDLFSNKNYEGNKKYDENPLLALQKVKELIKELKTSKDVDFILLNKTIPYKVCAKLITEHSDKLSKDEKIFCKEGIIENLRRLTLDNYDYQIGDGTEECTHALPRLIELFPDDKENFIMLFLLVLFDQSSIGNYKRICDYAIESLHNHNLWQTHPYIANQILNAYIKYKPLLNRAILELRNNSNYDFYRDERPSAIFEKFQELCDKNLENNEIEILLNIQQLTNLNIKDLEIVLQILPNDAYEPNHLALLNEILPKIAITLLNDKNRNNDNYDLYKTRLNIFRKIGKLLLSRKSNDEINQLIKPFLLNLKLNEYTANFIEYIIWSENDLNSNKNFWYIWHLLYENVVELFLNDEIQTRVDDSIIINYLLAWRYWGKEQKQWNSLKLENLWLYEKISNDLPNHPAILYSIARVLYSIGSEFHEEGIDWLFNIASSNPKLELRDLESDTLFYLEVLMRRYIFINREKIKQNFKLKNKIIEILNFMVERASVHGYLLRENIL